jgi:hypothetical protein
MTELKLGKKSRPRSRAEADALAAEYEASGVSRQEFCQQRNVAFKTLARYIVQRRKRVAAAVPSDSSPLVRVHVKPSSITESELTVIVTNGRRIAVKPGFPGELLRQLITVLEQA